VSLIPKNTLYDALQKLKKDPELILDPLFMMNIFTGNQDQCHQELGVINQQNKQ
jgi:hypothetical protein